MDNIRSQHPDWVNRDHVPTAKDDERQYSAKDFTDWYREYSAADTEVQGYAAVAQGISEGPTGQPSKYLMGLDNQGRGIIATGNPDTAKNVATFVPGTGSKLSGIGGDLTRSGRMRDAARNAGEPSTAVVTWYGYNAPPYLENATQGRYADAGAPDLARFQDGLRATHDGPRSHNVVVGHSYGTTVIGDAAIRGRSLNADDVVFVASPGTMTNRASDLSLTGIDPSQNGSHLFATKAENDPVPLFANTYAFGNDPTNSGYGAHIFESVPGDKTWYGRNPSVHSEYWKPGNPSLKSIGEILAGHGATVK